MYDTLYHIGDFLTPPPLLKLLPPLKQAQSLWAKSQLSPEKSQPLSKILNSPKFVSIRFHLYIVLSISYPSFFRKRENIVGRGIQLSESPLNTPLKIRNCYLQSGMQF